MNPQYDELEAFAKWYFSNRPFDSVHDGVTRVGKFSALALFRSGKFQVQLWVCDPNSEIPDHSHPNIDTIQVYMSGEVHLRVNGKPAMEEPITQLEDGRSSHNGRWLRVRPTDTHGATIGPLGGAFLNIQSWSNGNPTSAELDWIGEPLSDDHKAKLKI